MVAVVVSSAMAAASTAAAPARSKKIGRQTPANFFYPPLVLFSTMPPLMGMHQAEDRFWALVSLHLAGEATAEEHTELDTLLREHPEWGLRLELYTNLYKSQPKQDQPGDAFSRHLQRLSNHLDSPVLRYDTPPNKRRRVLRLFIGAAATLLVAIATIHLLQPPPKTDGFNTVTTRPASHTKIHLPDGTTVWLNADSRLSYSVNSTEREVQLTGEAYFDVTKDQNHPFHVHTPAIDILVLGTTFNVRSYNNEHNTEASLFQGSVEVTLRHNPDKKIILHPEEKITINNANEASVTGIKTRQAKETDLDAPLITVGKVHRQEKDSSATETLWTKNQLYFDDRSLEEIGFQLERWFGVRVTIADDRLKQLHFSGNFEEKSIGEVLEALQLTGTFHYSIHKKEVVITT
jgi:transmembrane sensor